MGPCALLTIVSILGILLFWRCRFMEPTEASFLYIQDDERGVPHWVSKSLKLDIGYAQSVHLPKQVAICNQRVSFFRRLFINYAMPQPWRPLPCRFAGDTCGTRVYVREFEVFWIAIDKGYFCLLSRVSCIRCTEWSRNCMRNCTATSSRNRIWYSNCGKMLTNNLLRCPIHR